LTVPLILNTQALVGRYHLSGKPTHDARLVAAMQVHGLDRHPDLQPV
jgi:hypothetical protein